MNMSRRSAWITAFAVASFLSFGSAAFADVTGKVTLDGKAPDMKTIDMSTVAACASSIPTRSWKKPSLSATKAN